MLTDKDGKLLDLHQVVLDPDERLLVIYEIDGNKIYCRNGGTYISWYNKHLKRVCFKEDIL